MIQHALRDIDDELGRIDGCRNNVTIVDAKHLTRASLPSTRMPFSRASVATSSPNRALMVRSVSLGPTTRSVTPPTSRSGSR